MNARNAESVSLVQQAIPAYFTLLYIQHIRDRELSKYQGFIHDIDVDQIPDDLGKDSEGEVIRDKVSAYFAFLRKTNRNLFSGSQTTYGGLPPSTRSPGSSGFTLGTAVELMNLQNLAELVKREISIAMGITPQREANYTNGTNVSDNQQAIVQSYTITEPLFFKHSEVWKEVLEDYLKSYRRYVENQLDLYNEVSISYWLPDNTQELLNVTPSHIEHSDIGLYLQGGSSSEKYAELMMQYSHAFAQNAGKVLQQYHKYSKILFPGLPLKKFIKEFK